LFYIFHTIRRHPLDGHIIGVRAVIVIHVVHYADDVVVFRTPEQLEVKLYVVIRYTGVGKEQNTSGRIE